MPPQRLDCQCTFWNFAVGGQKDGKTPTEVSFVYEVENVGQSSAVVEAQLLHFDFDRAIKDPKRADDFDATPIGWPARFDDDFVKLPPWVTSMAWSVEYTRATLAW